MYYPITNQICQQLNLEFYFYPQIDSTNSEALRLLQQDNSKKYVVIAGSQSLGRGRNRKYWHSPAADNIYLSLGLKIDDSKQLALSLSSAIAVIDAINPLLNKSSLEFGLKWPNDIYLDGKKIGGILIETNSNNLCVIGLGLNINMQNKDENNSKITQNWTSLSASLKQIYNLDKLSSKIISSLIEIINIHQNQGFTALKERWIQYHLWRNLPVKTINNQQETHGIARGITENGCLILETPKGIQTLLSGEISLRRA